MTYDAVVVGSGPNGLAAAITLASAGRSVQVIEAATTPGGGLRSEALTEPGYVHDTCATVVPLAAASPFFRGYDLPLVHPEVPFAHPLDGGRAVVVGRDPSMLGRDYERLVAPFAGRWQDVVDGVLAPLRVPRNPLLMARFGRHALRSVGSLPVTGDVRSMLAGAAAHSMLPLDAAPTAGVALFLAVLAHGVGWPVVEGGSQRLADLMVEHLRELGGDVVYGTEVRDLPAARAVLLDLTPRQVLAVAGDRLPARYRRSLGAFRYGPGVFKVDWALDGPIPWAATDVARAGTVHVGGSFEDIARAEAAVHEGRHTERPYVLLAQQTVFDPSRAPAGKHTAWAYCHVPYGSTVDMTERIEAQVERFAPGFRDRIVARATRDTAAMERHNANYVGGHINGGAQDLRQLFARPVARAVPYRTPVEGVYLCSSSTPPGGGVHGMCGYWAARAALRRELR